MTRGRQLDLFVWACCLAVLALAAVLSMGPDGALRLADTSLDQTCLARRCTGIACPFCGMSRSLVAFVHGHPSAAMAYHPLGPVMVFLFAGFVLAGLVAAWRHRPPVIETKAFSAVCLALVASSVVIWGVRLVAGTLL